MTRLPARLADEAYALGGETAADTYLRIDKLLDVAARSGADAVHPGYGFLSRERRLRPGRTRRGPDLDRPDPGGDPRPGRQGHRPAHRAARRRPAGARHRRAGGGRRRDRRVRRASTACRSRSRPRSAAAAAGSRWPARSRRSRRCSSRATREAVAAFGRGECFVERYLDRPRHVEAQVLADTHGNVIVVGTRDCSLQRRHQKLVEEAPAPFLTDEQRAQIHASAKAICREAGYHGAGTVEYLVGQDGTISFLEVNTRLQVEHPVSEETAGVDLVREQFRIADGERAARSPRIRRRAGTPSSSGSTARTRAAASCPRRARSRRCSWPAGPGVRVDAGVEAGSVIGGNFDSLLAKIIVTGATREEALERARRVLDETVIEGIATVLPFHRAVVRDPAFTGDRSPSTPGGSRPSGPAASRRSRPRAPAGRARRTRDRRGRGRRQAPRGQPARKPLHRYAHSSQPAPGPPAGAPVRQRGAAAGAAALTAPMQGTIVKVAVHDGDQVAEGDVIVVVEAMKMEQPLQAHRAGHGRRPDRRGRRHGHRRHRHLHDRLAQAASRRRSAASRSTSRAAVVRRTAQIAAASRSATAWRNRARSTRRPAPPRGPRPDRRRRPAAPSALRYSAASDRSRASASAGSSRWYSSGENITSKWARCPTANRT